jgi:hypothetical protein
MGTRDKLSTHWNVSSRSTTTTRLQVFIFLRSYGKSNHVKGIPHLIVAVLPPDFYNQSSSRMVQLSPMSWSSYARSSREVRCAAVTIMLQLTYILAVTQARASRRRPNDPAQQLFTTEEFEWFSKTSYNLALKYCAEMPPNHLVRLLNACIEVTNLLLQ